MPNTPTKPTVTGALSPRETHTTPRAKPEPVEVVVQGELVKPTAVEPKPAAKAEATNQSISGRPDSDKPKADGKPHRK